MKKIIILPLLLLTLNSLAQKEFPYKLKPITDGLITATAVASYGTSLILNKNKTIISESYINSLNSNDLNKLDYPSIKNYSPEWAKYSDVSLAGTAVIAGGISFLPMKKKEFFILAIMYAETAGTSIGINYAVKNMKDRARPMFYGSQISMEEKIEIDSHHKDGLKSFYSGHTSFAFTNASYISKVVFDLYPDKNWKYLVAGTAYVTASSIGYARWKAGKHFPTDIITGAFAGTLIGWAVPQLHKYENVSISFLPSPEGFVAGMNIKL